MVASAVVQGGRALAASAPMLMEKLQKQFPDLYKQAQVQIATKMGTSPAAVDLRKMSGDARQAAPAVQAVLDTGVDLNTILDMLPVSGENTRQAIAEVVRMHLAIRARGDAAAGGVTSGATESIQTMVHAVEIEGMVQRAARALNCNRISDLRVALDAIRAVDNDDLEGVASKYGDFVSNIPVQPMTANRNRG